MNAYTVNSSGRSNREVTPDVGVGSEVQLLDISARWLETFVRVLRRDSASDDVSLGSRLPLRGNRFRLHVVKVCRT